MTEQATRICLHNTVERRVDKWVCANPSCDETFVPLTLAQKAVDGPEPDAFHVALDGIAAVQSAVMWDQTERMVEFLLSHGATKEQADATLEEYKNKPFFLDAQQHDEEQ